jgi:hypothetical protein
LRQEHTTLTMIAKLFLAQANEQLQRKYKDMMYSLWMVMTTGEMKWASRYKTAEETWHPFFQSHAADEDIYDAWQWNETLPGILQWFEDRGLDTQFIYERADLSIRMGKSQANFCLPIDRSGDIRISCNLSSGQQSLSLLLHEIGHAYYEQGIQADLPFMLRQPAHPFLSEATALLFERLALSADWLQSGNRIQVQILPCL